MAGYNDNNYVGAPYNFVPFYKDVVEVEKKHMEIHDVLEDELLTGEIDYSVCAETPIFISDGKKDDISKKIYEDFFKNERGEYIIPGSSMRGLIRNNAQVLGLASFDDDIGDYNLMYRNVAAGAEKETYNGVLGNKPVNIGHGKTLGVLTHVKAGYITKMGNKYVIYMTDVDKISSNLEKMNYYVLSERNIANDMKNGKTSFPFFKEHPECLQNIMKDGFERSVIKGKIHYKEGYYKVSYDVANMRNITAVGNPGQYSKEGYLVCTGQMQGKKAKYIVPAIKKEKECITIPKEDIEAFQIDYNRKKNTLRGNKNFFALPDDGEIKPVFYIQLDRLYFGFTPRLRLFYNHKIKEGFLQKKTDFDYAKSLFGTINEKTGYKSKVAFTDVILDGKENKAVEHKVILSEPKPTSYLDYLKQTDETITYNQDGFELRGIKQYWLHKDIQKYEYKVNNEKVYTHLRPLAKGSKFKGVVRFQNLTKAELGLLLWSIRLEENSLMNIGKGKALGFGTIKISDMKLKIFNLSKAYDISQMIDFDPMEEKNIDEYIELYKEEINSKIAEKNIDKLESVKTFFKMHDGSSIPENDKIRYMSIDKREYQNRVRDNVALPSVDEVLSGKGTQKSNKDFMNKKNTPKKKIAVGSESKAEVKDYQGKKIKFFVDGSYISVAVENIKGIPDLTKKNMKEKLPKGTKVFFKCTGIGENISCEISII